MSRTTRTVIVLVFSLLVASVASLMVLRQVQSIPVREVEVANYQVAVAARNLPVGSLVSAADVKLVAWPASNQVAGAFTKVDEVVDRGLMAPMVANEPFTPVKVATREAGAGLPTIITPGMRAIAVRVDDVVGVAGFVVPGARVDVVVSITQQQQSVARVVVSNIEVLTAGTKIDQQQQQPLPAGRPQPTTVVTLLVSPDDAERISLAASVGRITLTLRNPTDAEVPSTDGTRVSSLLGAPDPPPPAPAPPKRTRARTETPAPIVIAPPAPPSIYTVETIRAAKRTEEVVR
jgi:pilus assembly protein CpaB